MAGEEIAAGVYFSPAGGAHEQVHEYQDGDYLLLDVENRFFLGDRLDERTLALTHADLTKLKVRVDAESFDHEEGFIEMCRDILRFGSHRQESQLRFFSIE